MQSPERRPQSLLWQPCLSGRCRRSSRSGTPLEIGDEVIDVLDAEALGYDPTLVAQHAINPYQDDLDQLETWTSASALAALTSGSRSLRRSSRISFPRLSSPRWRCRLKTSAAGAIQRAEEIFPRVDRDDAQGTA
jgi:hypothetical protein